MKLSTLAVISVAIAFGGYPSPLIATPSPYYHIALIATIPFMLVLYFALQAIKIPTYLKYTVYLVIGCIVTILLIWLSQPIIPDMPGPLYSF